MPRFLISLRRRVRIHRAARTQDRRSEDFAKTRDNDDLCPEDPLWAGKEHGTKRRRRLKWRVSRRSLWKIVKTPFNALLRLLRMRRKQHGESFAGVWDSDSSSEYLQNHRKSGSSGFDHQYVAFR